MLSYRKVALYGVLIGANLAFCVNGFADGGGVPWLNLSASALLALFLWFRRPFQGDA